jgi:hypothetical protein
VSRCNASRVVLGEGGAPGGPDAMLESKPRRFHDSVLFLNKVEVLPFTRHWKESVPFHATLPWHENSRR